MPAIVYPAGEPNDDTTAEARAAQLEVLRRFGPDGRLRAGLRFSRSMIELSRAELRARHPGADECTLKLLWIEQSYGAALAEAVARRLGVRDRPVIRTPPA